MDMVDPSPNSNKAELVLTLIFLNASDAALGDCGLLSSDQVRVCTADVVVDTKVGHLCLPIDLIQKLGLKRLEKVDRRTDSGIQATHLYGWVMFDIDGSADHTCRCVALPAGQRAVLGRIPLAAMGLEPDPEYPQALRSVPIRV